MKITIITGGSKGIGKNIVTDLLNKNHKIYNISKTDCIINNNNNLININIDINDINIKDKIKEILSNEEKIDNFIHCAGITKDVFFHKMNYEQWIYVQNTNFLSLYNLLNPIVNNMRNNNSGNIVLVSSVNAKNGALGQTNYASSKSALFGFTKSLMLENASKNILVNCICPGYIETAMTKKIDINILNKIIENIPLKKMGSTQDISDLVDFLIEKNKYMTGSIIDINGGL